MLGVMEAVVGMPCNAVLHAQTTTIRPCLLLPRHLCSRHRFLPEHHRVMEQLRVFLVRNGCGGAEHGGSKQVQHLVGWV